MASEIKYNGRVIGTATEGKDIVLNCRGKRMKDRLVISAPHMKLQEKTVTENGPVTPDAGFDGLSKVTVNVAREVVEEWDGTVVIE